MCAQPSAVKLTPIIDGGGHERGMRSGTLNVPGIVGLGAACRHRAEGNGRGSETADRQLRERLKNGILAELDEVCINGHRPSDCRAI